MFGGSAFHRAKAGYRVGSCGIGVAQGDFRCGTIEPKGNEGPAETVTGTGWIDLLVALHPYARCGSSGWPPGCLA